MNKKYIAWAVIAIIVVGGGSFWGGMAYANSSRPSFNRAGAAAFTGRGGATGAAGARGGGFTAGTILSKDATSITVKMQNGSTAIVLVSPTTAVMKAASGTLDDLSVGTNVVVTGSANSDGSVTAQSVQIRPAMPTAAPQ